MNDLARGTLGNRQCVSRGYIYYIIDAEGGEAMQPDLNHIERSIKQHEADIQEARRQAQVHRDMADQRRNEGSMTGPDYYEQEADKLEQHATELEAEVDELKVQKERLEKRLSELEAQKAQLSAENTERLTQLAQEIASIRGTSFML